MLRIPGDNLFRIPPNVTFDEAATYAVAFQTSTMGLYQSLKLPEPYNGPGAGAQPILIWGGASK